MKSSKNDAIAFFNFEKNPIPKEIAYLCTVSTNDFGV